MKSTLPERVSIFPRASASAGSLPEFSRSLEEILADKEELQLLRFMSDHYADLFSRTNRICERLSRCERTCCLLDFDIVRHYFEMQALEEPIKSLGTLALEQFFLEGSTTYAFPLGAFNELLDFLTYKAPIKRETLHLQYARGGVLSSAEVLRQVAISLRVRDPDVMDAEELEAEVGNALDENIIHLGRLLGLLRNPRFVGVYTDYDKAHYEGWYALLEKAERRYGKGDINRRNRRDAINLAVASADLAKQAVKRDYLPGKDGFLLISETSVVLNLLSYADSDAAARQLAVEKFGANIFSLKSEYPVIHPRDLLFLELLGGVAGPAEVKDTRRRSRQYAQQFRELQNSLHDELSQATDRADSEIVSAAMVGFEAARRMHLTDLLQEIDDSFRNSRERLRLVEHRRAMLESVKLARLEWSREEASEMHLAEKSLSFSRLLGEIGSLLSINKSLVYATEISLPTKGCPFTSFTIYDGSTEDRLAIVAGEVYYLDHGSAQPSYYSVRWPTTCSDKDFILAIRQSWDLRVPPHDINDRGIGLRPVLATDEAWHEGVIVSTSTGNYRVPFGWVGPDWEGALIGKLKELFEVSKSPANATQVIYPGINRLRINSGFGDIIYDIIPDVLGGDRYVTVVSHWDLKTQIAALYFLTGERFVGAGVLRGELARMLGCFAPPAPNT